jgi:hypothetical protein
LRTRSNLCLTSVLTIVATSGLGIAFAGPQAGAVIPLPREDQKVLDQYLGKGVVGDAVAAGPLNDPSKYYPLRVPTLGYRLTSGEQKGSEEDHVFTELKRDHPGVSWKEAWGEDDALFLNQDDDGNIYLVSHNEHAEGVITQYLIPEPMVLTGMKPGESRTAKSKLNVYDLAHPDHLSHNGHLDVKLTYVGAYRVTVPQDSYEAVLLKWEYKGKIGPAKVVDVQYRLLAEDVGTVAMIEKKSVSAMMVYNEHANVGSVLVSKKRAP